MLTHKGESWPPSRATSKKKKRNNPPTILAWSFFFDSGAAHQSRLLAQDHARQSRRVLGEAGATGNRHQFNRLGWPFQSHQAKPLSTHRISCDRVHEWGSSVRFGLGLLPQLAAVLLAVHERLPEAVRLVNHLWMREYDRKRRIGKPLLSHTNKTRSLHLHIHDWAMPINKQTKTKRQSESPAH